jgi:hypothetical protein
MMPATTQTPSRNQNANASSKKRRLEDRFARTTSWWAMRARMKKMT